MEKNYFYTLSCHTYTIKKNHWNLLYNTWNSAQCYAPAWLGVGFGGEWIHVYVWLSTSTHCSPETITTLLISYTLIQNKKFKVWGKNKTVDGLQGAWVRSQVRELRTCMPLGAAKNQTKPLEHISQLTAYEVFDPVLVVG